MSKENQHENSDLLWRQYALHVDLYKFYLETSIKLNAFHYAITGAILSYVLAHPEQRLVKLALFLPALMSFGFGLLFFYGAAKLPAVREEVREIVGTLQLATSPELRVLIFLLLVFGVVSCLVGLGLMFLISPCGPLG